MSSCGLGAATRLSEAIGSPLWVYTFRMSVIRTSRRVVDPEHKDKLIAQKTLDLVTRRIFCSHISDSKWVIGNSVRNIQNRSLLALRHRHKKRNCIDRKMARILGFTLHVRDACGARQRSSSCPLPSPIADGQSPSSIQGFRILDE